MRKLAKLRGVGPEFGIFKYVLVIQSGRVTLLEG